MSDEGSPQRVAFPPPEDPRWGEDRTLWLGEEAPGAAQTITLDARQGHRVYVRRIDPCDPPPERIPVHPGDEVWLMGVVSHTAVHQTPEVGRLDDLLVSLRLVPVARRGNVVSVRSLRRGEPDDGRRVHLRPGDRVQMEPGSLQVSLDLIDAVAAPDATGYSPLSGTLLTWFTLPSAQPPEEVTRYLLSAARRLDTAQRHLLRVRELRDALDASGPGSSGPTIRAQMLELIGEVEAGLIALSRAVVMATSGPRVIGVQLKLSQRLKRARDLLPVIRDPYEHVESSALGRGARGSEDPDASSIFDYESLLVRNRVVYGSRSLDLTTEVPAIVADARALLKALAASASAEQGSVAEAGTRTQ